MLLLLLFFDLDRSRIAARIAADKLDSLMEIMFADIKEHCENRGKIVELGGEVSTSCKPSCNNELCGTISRNFHADEKTDAIDNDNSESSGTLDDDAPPTSVY